MPSFQTLEKRMSELTDAVDALSIGVASQGTALSAALGRIQEDFSAVLSRLDVALADDAEAQAAVARIRENLALMQQSTDTLTNLDLDPNNPVIPPPPPGPDTPTDPTEPTEPTDPATGGEVVSG